MPRAPLHSRRRTRRKVGFTLAETLVAIGAVALLSVGIAAVFQSVGETVTTGRRVSAFNQYVTLIERQMRRDFEQMSRDGFLVIHHQYAVNPNTPNLPAGRLSVLPYEGAPLNAGRPRRIDEVMFFARGDFASSREPMAPGVIASSANAAVYYGHGAQWPTVWKGDAFYDRPEVDGDRTFTAVQFRPLVLGYAPTTTTPVDEYPNQYASSWTLLRHVTLLAAPSSTDRRYAPSGIFGLQPTSPYLIDQELQIALQPASSHLFRGLARVIPGAGAGGPGPGLTRPLRDQSGAPATGRPASRSTGLVDIATTDLSEIRAISQTLSSENMSEILRPSDIGSASDFNNFRRRQVEVGGIGGFNTIPHIERNNLTSSSSNDAKTIEAIQEWMRDALPANSCGDDNGLGMPDRFTRMRAEPTPPDYFTASTLSNELERTYRRADQLMLASSNFVPRCTEFMVEWSFGQTDTSGRTVWYGGKQALGVGDTIRLYPGNAADVGNFATWHRPFMTHPSAMANQHTITPYLIYPYQQIDDYQSNRPLNQAVAHFGYIDPTYPATGTPGANDPRTVAWAWPRMIRVTMTLADPTDPAIEQSFQFIFEVPEDPRP